MPVKRRSSGPPDARRFKDLYETLAQELTAPKDFGVPIVDEETFPRTGLKGVTVIWNKWNGLSDSERTAVILEAYMQAFGKEEKDRVAFAVGLTVEDAIEAGNLPFTILPSLRRTDAVTPEKVREVMADLGAVLEAGDYPAVLRFSSREDAEACRRKLSQILPGSDDIWTIAQEVQRPEWARG